MHHWKKFVFLASMLFLVGLSAYASPAFAQAAVKTKKKTEKKLFEDLTLRTSDDVKLSFRFYGGAEDKRTIPVMIIHEYGGQGSTYFPLAEALQSKANGGCAVIVPDLRGHGQSVEQRVGEDDYVELDSQKMRRDDIEAIVSKDLVAIKRFLVGKNNEGKLNIDMLCVIGVDRGCIYAMNWIHRDWSRKQLVGYRRGKDPKAFVLISPKQTHMRLTMRDALRHPVVRGDLSAMLIYGDRDSKSATAVRRINNALKPHHPNKFTSDADRQRKQDLFVRDLETSLSGGELVNQASLKIPAMIAAFIDLRIASREEDFTWAIREDPFQRD